MKPHFLVLFCVQALILTTGFGQTESVVTSVPDSEIAKTPEYQAAKAAEKKVDGAAMLVQAKLLVERFPNSALAHKAMSDAYYYMNFLDEAAASAETAIRISPKDPIAWRNLGHIREAQHKSVDAEAAYKNAVNSAKNDPAFWANLGVFYAAHNNEIFALQCATSASKLLKSTAFDEHNGESSEATTWAEVGFIFIQIKKPNEAISYLKRSITLQPDVCATWYALGTAHILSNDRPNALLAVQQALKINPDFEDAKTALKMMTVQQDQTQKPAVGQQQTASQINDQLEMMKKFQELQNLQSQQQGGASSALKEYNDTVEQLRRLEQSGTPSRNKKAVHFK